MNEKVIKTETKDYVKDLKKCKKKQSMFQIFWGEYGEIVTILSALLIYALIDYIWIVPIVCNNSWLGCSPESLETITDTFVVWFVTFCIGPIAIAIIFAICLGIYIFINSFINYLRFTYRLTRLPLTKEELDICNIKTIKDYDEFLKSIATLTTLSNSERLSYPEKVEKKIIHSVLEIFTEKDIEEYLLSLKDNYKYCYIQSWLHYYTDWDVWKFYEEEK